MKIKRTNQENKSREKMQTRKKVKSTKNENQEETEDK